MNKNNLCKLINETVLHRLAGTRSFLRGKDYYISGQVSSSVDDGLAVTAQVRGTRKYTTRLWIGDEGLEYSCTCPMYSQGEFCKHCVAVGLAYLGGKYEDVSFETAADDKDVGEYLTNLPKEALIRIIMAQTESDDRLKHKLLMKAAKNKGEKLNLKSYYRAIDSAVEVDYVDYNSMWEYAGGIEWAIKDVQGLLEEGYYKEVVELSEYFIRCLENQLNSVDDSDGYMRGLINELQDIHHSACLKAQADPDKLAERLFQWELNGEWETFHGAVKTYADVLGEKGIKKYRTLAEQEWEKVPSLEPGKESADRYDKRY